MDNSQITSAARTGTERTALHHEYLTPAQAALLSGFSIRALESLRSRGIGPRYFRVGRSIRYRVDDLRIWVEQCSGPSAQC